MTTQREKSKSVDSQPRSVDQSKRSFAKAGITVPVIMTLAGRPVTGFGAMCLSQEMSGNASYTGDGSCELGSSPSVWKLPNSSTPGQLIEEPDKVYTAQVSASWTGNNNKKVEIKKIVKIKTTPHIWNAINQISYGDLIIIETITSITETTGQKGSVEETITVKSTDNSSSWEGPEPIEFDSIQVNDTFTPGTIVENGEGGIGGTGSNLPNCEDFSGGTKFSAIFGGGSDEPMRKLLCESTDSLESHAIAAYLNALQNPNYVLKPNQVVALYNGEIEVPPNYTSLAHFLSATWQ